MSRPESHKVGRISVAVGLVAFGVALLIDNLNPAYGATWFLLKLWPVLLIGLGAEYLIRSLLAQRNPSEVKLRFDVGGAFLLALVILLSFSITTIRNWLPDITGGRIPNLSIGPSVQHQESHTIAAENVKELEVNVPVGSIRLERNHRNDEIRVEATYTAVGLVVDRDEVRRELEAVKVQVKEGDTVQLSVESPARLGSINTRFVIYAPPDLKVRAEANAGTVESYGYQGDLHLTTRAGRITVQAGAGELKASTGSGSITVTNFDGPVDARTSVGSLSLRNIGGPVQLDSGTGSIDVQEFRDGKLVAETRTGGIHAYTSSPLQGDVMLKTQNGSITLSMPNQGGIRATAQTRAGSLSVPDFMAITRNGPSSSAVGSVGDGAHAITLEASTGSVNFSLR